MSQTILFNSRKINASENCYVIAEVGVNHNGNIELAHKCIDEAKKSGADAVKFQTFIADLMLTKYAKQADYQKRNIGFETSQFEMIKKLELPLIEFESLKKHCDDCSIDFISSAFDSKSLDYIANLKPAFFKWPSGEITNRTLIEQAIGFNLPIVFSTGMCDLDEVEKLFNFVNYRIPMALLQCVSNYPSEIKDQNLSVIKFYIDNFNCPAGFSDHTLGPYAAIAARPFGMSILEKHFTLDSRMNGPDHLMSMEPKQFAEMVQLLRDVELAIGDGNKKIVKSEINTKEVARKSLVYKNNFPDKYTIKLDDLLSKRPGCGISPENINKIIGKKLSKQVYKDQLVKIDDFY